MPEYPERRNRYKSLNPQDFAPGTPKFDNPKKYEGVVYSRPAKRNQTPPSKAFRVTTAPKPPESMPEPPKPYVEPIPPMQDWQVSTMPIKDEKELE